jgi:hypothetical protein
MLKVIRTVLPYTGKVDLAANVELSEFCAVTDPGDHEELW